jgi:tripartite-type tricarboxylate transporter receptor subunit TctC
VRKGTPAEATARLSAALLESLADPGLQKRIADLGQELPSASERTPQGMASRHRADIEKWWPMIKAANIKAE